MTNDQTGEYSFHTEYKDRAIMFHVSTLFPHDPNDTDHVSIIIVDDFFQMLENV